jgi:hypothetical protein
MGRLGDYGALMRRMRPWVVATPPARGCLLDAPLGARVAPGDVFDPFTGRSEGFLARLARFDELVYGPLGLTLPRWAFYDCAEVPGVLFGLGQDAGEVPRHVRQLFGAAEGELVPLSMLIAVPTLEPGHWIAYSLASLDEVSAGACRPGTGVATLALGLDLLGARRVTATAQWASTKLSVHARFAPLAVRAAWLPAHDEPASCAFAFDVDVARVRAALEERPRRADDPVIDAFDRRGLERLQARLEEGERVWITAPPVPRPDGLDVPVRIRAALAEPQGEPEDRSAAHPGGSLEATSTPERAGEGGQPERASLERLRPFVVATPDNLARLDLAPLGRPIAPEDRFDPLVRPSLPLLRLLERLDRVAFGPEGMPMPRWLFFDGAELPGAVVGLGRGAAALSDDARALLGVPDGYEGVVPLAMYIAMPTVEPGGWLGHNLASVGRRLPGAPLSGLGRLTKAVALSALRCRLQVGATQWDSAALHVHTRMGPLELVTAWTPAHSEPWTLTYRVRVDGAVLEGLAGRGAARPALAPTTWIRSDDHDAMRALQARLEAGERWRVAARPEPLPGGGQRVPVTNG